MPTARAWLVLAVVVAGCAVLVATSITSFLSVNQPVSAEVLIVESWIPDYAYRSAIEEFRRGGYKYLLTTGLTLPEPWLVSKFKSGAEFAAANLAALGLKTNAIVALAPTGDKRDRTYLSGLAVKKWVERQHVPIRAVNIYTHAAHARRTKLLFEKALGENVKVGVLACPDNAYDLNHWWKCSYGFRKVSGEAIAYLYARFMFRAAH